MVQCYLFNRTQGSFWKQVEILYQYNTEWELVVSVWEEIKLPLEQFSVIRVD